MASGTDAASGPIEVPATTRVKGTSATSRMMNGKDRTVLTIQFSTAKSGRFSSDCPGPSRKISTPSGPPTRIAAERPMPSMRKVWPMASQSSGSTAWMLGGMSSIMSCIRSQGETAVAPTRSAGPGAGESLVIGFAGPGKARQLPAECGPSRHPRLGHRELLGHGAVLDHGDMPAQAPHHREFMRDDDDRHPERFVDLLQRVEHASRGLGIERGR